MTNDFKNKQSSGARPVSYTHLDVYKRQVYRTVDHDSLKMSNGKWFWWSQGFGGYNALLLLINLAVVAYFLFLWCLICLGISLSYFSPCL